MYFYFYDKFVQDKQHDATVAAVESRLIELGINGRVEKLSIFKNVQELVRDAVKKGATTVVAVGNDATFTTVANIVVNHEVTLGFIPVVEGSRFAEVLGIPTGAGACDVLSKRLCETIDVGKVRDHYFVGSLRVLNPNGVTLRCDDQYTISTTAATTDVSIMNVGDVLDETPPRMMNCTDGRVDIVIAPVVETGMLHKKKVRQEEKETVIPVQRVVVDTVGGSAQLQADHGAMFTTPCEVTVLPKALTLIVGRDRLLGRGNK